MGNVKPLEIYEASALMTAILKEKPWFVEDFLTVGVTLLVGDPKIGKSWLILDLMQSLSCGSAFWGYATSRVDVLYLALEDTLARLQSRLWKIADESSNRFRFALTAGTLDTGLIEQLEMHLAAFPSTKVIAIDTLRLVRGNSAASSSVYSAEYLDVHRLKEFADEHDIAVIVVHHTRKASDSDVFKTVSGTQGLLGAADQTMILCRDSRADASATLAVTGRDVGYCEFSLKFENCRWVLVERLDEDQVAVRKIPDDIHALIAFAESMGVWEGSATELASILPTETSPAVLAKRIAEHRSFLRENNVEIVRTRTNSARTLHIVWEPNTVE